MSLVFHPAPEVGQAVRVRNRLASVRSVEPSESKRGETFHLVELDYLDDFSQADSEQVLWEAEATAEIIGKTSLPAVDEHNPDAPWCLEAFVNANRWNRLNRLRPPGGADDDPVFGVWNSAVQVHPYQLEPVIRALEMPRVNLLLCDGVGLGKTIQAGLVLEELLLRRRIRRVLVLCPAMLQRQWRSELKRKFNLDFEIIDSDSTFNMRRQLGIDTNPWKAFPRVIASMDYLRMPDILQQFKQSAGHGSAAEGGNGAAAHAAWDLLIVDECHNFAPQGGGRSSQRTRMLQEIRFLFEHRVFLSATPHNGKTVCFTGLLELLDPVRFQMKTELEPADRDNLLEIRIRRLKEDINRNSIRPPFAEQLPPVELPVELTGRENDLYGALRRYRDLGQNLLDGFETASERNVGQFVFSLLTKRLLSCPFAFARTWWRHLQDDGGGDGADLFDLARVSSEKAEETQKSDDEKTLAEEDAARHGGAWFRKRRGWRPAEMEAVNQALEDLGLDRSVLLEDGRIETLAARPDSKTRALIKWALDNLFTPEGALRDDERLIVFTEYKETLRYLEQCFLREGFDPDTMRLLYGGMGAAEFEAVQRDFEDPAAPVRLLLATDAASEGINMQECCRWVIHYDIPWSPTKIQQRNGRVARHGQLRDVQTYYFRHARGEDFEFLLRIAKKVERVREDLGSVERVFGHALQEHFRGRTSSDDQLDRMIEEEADKSSERADLGIDSGDAIRESTRNAQERLAKTARWMHINHDALAGVLRAALTAEGGGSLDEIQKRPGFFRLTPPPRWEALVRETLTHGLQRDRMELVFDTALVEEEISNRRMMRIGKHQCLMRLGHPVMRQAMATLTRQLHDPSSKNPVRRWSVAAIHRADFEAALLLYYTVSVLNDLREPLHDEVRAAAFFLEGDGLREMDERLADDFLETQRFPVRSNSRLDEWVKTIRRRWLSHREFLEAFMEKTGAGLAQVFEERALAAKREALEAERGHYKRRLSELKALTNERELRKLVEARLRAEAETEQSFLFPEFREDKQRELRDIETQIALKRRDVEQTRGILHDEFERRQNTVLPRRFSIREIRVLPLAAQYVVPALAEDIQS